MTIPHVYLCDKGSITFISLIALRYASLKRHGTISSFLTWVSLLGLTLSVATLITVVSVMNGFERELQSRLLSLIPDAKVHFGSQHHPFDEHTIEVDWKDLLARLVNQNSIDAATPFIERTAMVNVDSQFQVVDMLAIDYSLEQAVTGINNFIIAGNADQLEDDKYGIVIGRLLALKLGLTLGDKLQLMLPKVAITPAGIVMREKRFTVVAIFEVGAEIDQNLAIINLLTGQKLLAEPSRVDGLRLSFVKNVNVQQRLDTSLMEVASAHPEYAEITVLDWRNEQRSLFSAIAMEKIIIFVLLLAVVAVAAFNIISIVLMSVMDKHSDIAVLKTMGATSHQIRIIFILQGLSIASMGTLLGASLGLLIAPNIGFIVSSLEQIFNWQLFDPNVFYIAHLPSELRWFDVIATVFSALLISFFASIYPAQKAASVPPAAALSYDI